MSEGDRYCLVVTRGETKGKVFYLEEGENVLGRWDPDAGAFPEIDLDQVDVDSKVSRQHAVVRVSEETLLLEDLGSLNGTFINRSERLEANAPQAIHVGDEVIVGKIFLRLETR